MSITGKQHGAGTGSGRSGPWRWLEAALSYRTAGRPPAEARAVRLLNTMTMIGIASTLLYALRYGMIDLEGLAPLVLWSLFAVVPLSLPLLLYGFPLQVPVTALYMAITAVLVGFCFLAGPESGVHFFLLVGPTVLLFTGSRLCGHAVFVTMLTVGAFTVIHMGLLPGPPVAPLPPEVAQVNTVLSIASSMAIIFVALFLALRLASEAEAALEREYQRSESLLLNILPNSIAARLKDRPQEIIADQFDDVTILFADIVGFTPRAGSMSPSELVGFLNGVFSEFDRLTARYGLEKVKTIGDAYMVAGGMPDRRDGHAPLVGRMALDMMRIVDVYGAKTAGPVELRIGIHTGPAVAGVIGTQKLFYDVWGDTVNTASRMESLGTAGRIQVTQEAMAALGPDFVFEERGEMEIRGKGKMKLFYLVGCTVPDPVAAAAPGKRTIQSQP
jgi:adenylate cyclase